MISTLSHTHRHTLTQTPLQSSVGERESLGDLYNFKPIFCKPFMYCIDIYFFNSVKM